MLGYTVVAGADPELLGGGANPQRRGRQPKILVIFSEKPYEIKEILVRRGGARRGRPPSPTKSATADGRVGKSKERRFFDERSLS